MNSRISRVEELKEKRSRRNGHIAARPLAYGLI